MAVAFDAQSDSTLFTSTDPMTWTHTPVGTPRGVAVLFTSIQDTPTIAAVTYGGQALTLVRRENQTGPEPGWVAIYFLGAGIPTGAQTVSIDHNGDGVQKQAACVTVTAGGDTEIGADGGNQDVGGNPQVPLTTTPVSLRVVCLYNTADSTLGFATLAGHSPIYNYSSGFRNIRADRQTSPSAGLFTAGYTFGGGGGSEDYAVVAAAIQEAPPAVPPDAPTGLTASRDSALAIGLTWLRGGGGPRNRLPGGTQPDRGGRMVGHFRAGRPRRGGRRLHRSGSGVRD